MKNKKMNDRKISITLRSITTTKLFKTKNMTSNTEIDQEWNGLLDQVYNATQEFYKEHSQLIKVSHGWNHVNAVYMHSIEALKCRQDLSLQCQVEIQVAALLHDVDDEKYFPQNSGQYINARQILNTIFHFPIAKESIETIIEMISYVSCSNNGNTVPTKIIQTDSYHLLIPRWCDRLEAVGTIGVVRCYQYNRERNEPLFSNVSPQATTIDEVWMYATPERFIQYQTKNGPQSNDMISHYYDKLLHVARPPPNIVRNEYLERMANDSCIDLIEVCIRFGRTGKVDEQHILDLQKLCSR